MENQISLSQIIANYMPLLLAVVGIVITWVKMGDKIDSLSERVKKLEEGAGKRDDILIDIRLRLVGIESLLKQLSKKDDGK